MHRLIRYSFVLLGFGMLAFAALLHFSPENSQAPVAPAEQVSKIENSAPQEEYSLRAVLEGVGDNLSVGLATQRALGGDFMILINAQLSPPSTGSVYYGWLVNSAPELRAISLGRLTQELATPNMWQVVFRTASPLPDYEEIWITREPEHRDDDAPPGTIILKGRWGQN
jgi:hypothetical protein